MANSSRAREGRGASSTRAAATASGTPSRATPRAASGGGARDLREAPESEPAGELEIAREGRRIDLLVDGISYSTWHPDQPWSGYVWDPLAACVLLRDWRAPRVLLLGAGAGTVLLLARRLRPDAQLTAVERDARVLRAARERFGLDAIDAEVVEGDGLDWLARTRRRFDLVLDDMYCPGADGLARPVADEGAHLGLVASRLVEGGVAATNSTTDDDPPGLESALATAYRARLPHRVRLVPRLGWNVVLAGSTQPLDSRAVRDALSRLDPVDRVGVAGVKLRRA